MIACWSELGGACGRDGEGRCKIYTYNIIIP
jgi:hypothetical protein